MSAKQKDIETVIRTELREIRYRIKQGKGEFGSNTYVTDSIWWSWLHVEATLSQALVKAGLDDGKE